MTNDTAPNGTPCAASKNAAALDPAASLSDPQILDERTGFVLAYTGSRNAQPFVTWAVFGSGFAIGHYFQSEAAARSDFDSRQ